MSVDRPGAAHATDRFGFLFLELLILFGLTALVDDSGFLRLVQALLVVAIVLTTLRASGTKPRGFRTAFVLAVPLALLLAFGSFAEANEVVGTASIIVGLVMASGVVMIVRRIFEHDRVTLQQVIAALAAYLETALVFAFVYAGVDSFSDGRLLNGDLAVGASGGPEYLYFSVVTMTTLGYGDLTPATQAARTLVMVETLFGQIFLVVLVAYLVGSLGRRRPQVLEEAQPEQST